MGDNQTSSMNIPLDSSGVVGYKVGSWVHATKNKKATLMTIVLLGFVSFMIYTVVISYKNMDSNNSLIENVGIYAKSISHSKCKSRGGCSVTCPYIDGDDPRVVIKSTNVLVAKGLAEIEEEYNQRINTISSGLDHISDTKAKESATSEISIIDSNMRRCVNNVAKLSSMARDIDYKYGDEKTTSVQVLNSRNNASTIRAAASVSINAFFASSAYAIATMMYYRLQSIPSIDQGRIPNYENKITVCKLELTGIQTKQNEIMKLIADTPDIEDTYERIVTQIQREQKTLSQKTNERLATMIAIGKAANTHLQKILSHFTSLSDEYNSVMQRAETFNNSLPEGQIKSEDVSNLISDGDYNTAMIRIALESEISKNHRKFAKERATFDSGGGVPSVRDDDNDIVSWVGLFGRPTYRRSDGSSVERSSEPLKSIPSDNPNDLMRAAVPRLAIS